MAHDRITVSSVVASLGAAGAVLSLLAVGCDGVSRVHRLELVDDGGRVVGVLDATGGVPRLELGAEGEPGVVVRAGEAPTVQLRDERGIARAELSWGPDWSAVVLRDADALVRAKLAGGQQPTLELRATPDTVARIEVDDRDGARLWFSLGAQRSAAIDLGDAGYALGPDLALRDGDDVLVLKAHPAP